MVNFKLLIRKRGYIMSAKYDKLLEELSKNVRKAFYWIRKSIPEFLIDIPGVDY